MMLMILPHLGLRKGQPRCEQGFHKVDCFVKVWSQKVAGTPHAPEKREVTLC